MLKSKKLWKVNWDLLQEIIRHSIYRYFFAFDIQDTKSVSEFYKENLKNITTLEALIKTYLNYIIRNIYVSLYEIQALSDWERYMLMNEENECFFEFILQSDIDVMVNYYSLIRNDNKQINLKIEEKKLKIGDPKLALVNLKKVGLNIPFLEIQEIFGEVYSFNNEELKKEIEEWINKRGIFNKKVFENMYRDCLNDVLLTFKENKLLIKHK